MSSRRNGGRGGYGGANSGKHLLSFSYAGSDRLLNAESSARDIAGSGGGGRGSGGRGRGGGASHHGQASRQASERIDPNQAARAAVLQRFQFVVSRDDLGHPALRQALSNVDAPPPWEIVKFVAVRCPLDDFTCPICLDQPLAACASATCGHFFCLRCVYALAIHAWEAQRVKQSPPPSQAIPVGGRQTSASSETFGGTGRSPPTTGAKPPALADAGAAASFLPDLTDRALGSYIRGGCPMCNKPLSLRALVPLMHIPSAAAKVGETLTFEPVRQAFPLQLGIFGTEAATFRRLTVESDASFAWVTQQAIDMADALNAAARDVDEAETQLAVTLAAEEQRQRADHARRTSTQSGGMAATLFGANNAPFAIMENDTTRLARANVRAARIDAEATRLAHMWFSDLVAAEADGAPLTDADLDVFAIYGEVPGSPNTPMRTQSGSVDSLGLGSGGRGNGNGNGNGNGKPPFGHFPSPGAVPQLGRSHSDNSFATAAPAPEGVWAYQCSDGQQLYLHPLVAKMLVETAAEQRLGAQPKASAAPADTPAALEADDGFGAGGAAEPPKKAPNVQPGSAAQPPQPPEAVVAKMATLQAADLPRVTVKLDEIEEVEQTRAWRSSNKALWFVPIGGAFTVAFPTQLPRQISKAVLTRYRAAIESRRKKRAQKDRRENEEAERAKHRDAERQRRRNANDPGRHVYGIPAAQHYTSGEAGVGSSAGSHHGLSVGDSPQLDFAYPPPGTEAPEAMPTTAPGDAAGGASNGSSCAARSPQAGPAAPKIVPNAWAPRTRNILSEQDAPSLDAIGATATPAAAAAVGTQQSPSATTPKRRGWG